MKLGSGSAARQEPALHSAAACGEDGAAHKRPRSLDDGAPEGWAAEAVVSTPTPIAAPGAGAAAAAAAAALPDAPMFLTRVEEGLDEPWANEGFLGVRLSDLVCGDILWCLATTLNCHIRWLLSTCPDLLRCPSWVLVHHQGPEWLQRAEQYRSDMSKAGLLERCCLHPLNTLENHGRHHSKAFLIEYAAGLRVVISSGNLECSQFATATQALFTQDFPLKDKESPPSSPFQEALARYLAALELPEPHRQRAQPPRLVGVPPPGALLAAAEPLPPRFAAAAGGQLIGQASSLSEYLAKEHACRPDYLASELVPAMSRARIAGVPAEPTALPRLSIVWPTEGEVKQSLTGWYGGSGLSAARHLIDELASRQDAPKLHRWGGAPAGRQRALPHMKALLLHDEEEVAWSCFGSHNLSKAAWGKLLGDRVTLKVLSYELSVLLLPEHERTYQRSRWRDFSCTAGTPPLGSHPGVHKGTPVRYVPWRRGMPQAPTMAAGGSGALVVPLPLPFELAPAPLPAKDRWWWQRQDHIDAELTAKDDAKLGLDCHRLHHSEHGGGQGMRRSLLAGGSWQRDIIAVLQHQAAALRGGPGAPIPRPSAKLVGAARDWKAAAEAAARAAAAEAADAGHCAYCTHRLSPWERWRCQTCGVGPGGEWFACGGCAQWRGFAAARLDPPTPQLDRSHEDSKRRRVAAAAGGGCLAPGYRFTPVVPPGGWLTLQPGEAEGRDDRLQRFLDGYPLLGPPAGVLCRKLEWLAVEAPQAEGQGSSSSSSGGGGGGGGCGGSGGSSSSGSGGSTSSWPVAEDRKAARHEWELERKFGRQCAEKAKIIGLRVGVLCGKWVLYASEEHAPAVWRAIAQLVHDNGLPGVPLAKVSVGALARSMRVICVYTCNFANREEAMAVAQRLAPVLKGVMPGRKECKLSYKPEICTLLGLYGDGARTYEYRAFKR
ncbi:tyrosyl-DNA phosphodiesterase 1 [Micractinium conductrix]|uniref:Tyrosyl-DNA phosphodiesterase 1 n=1 Tax=Micractinium conductrix TaxID=554055 RepID=A0A2P6VDB1_9CHLO|nr:tyrosyl-DNA phosphodiesterase 1 [Micractinium conductrix]|eukprot:PSC72067.1 tyrosyl-DNA phosphodiesterase 1 [Micractinium conductrix]